MNGDYSDILAAVPTPPLWFDENGAPRYAEFHRRLRAYPYAAETALVVVACQACLRKFRVCCSDGIGKLSGRVQANDQWLYGDPPSHSDPWVRPGNCSAGDYMNTYALEVLEFWQSKGPGQGHFHRVHDLERVIVNPSDPNIERIARDGWWP